MMESNEFVAKLKANGSEKDLYDLNIIFEEYKRIIVNFSSKDRGALSLNVLCILFRNLDTVPTWSAKINIKELLALSIECVRHTRCLDKPQRVKTLGCIFSLHKYIITKKLSAPPELVLKLSLMPFECDDDSLLHEYYKTYGHIIIDRLTYIGKLKSTQLPILKLLPKLIEDIIKTIKMYDTILFCTNMLTFLVKKICYIYNDSPEEINKMMGKIFDCISMSDFKGCNSLPEKEAYELYVKLNECLFAITENSLKINFKNSILDSVTRVSVSLLGHKPDMFHCFQNIFLNSLCCIFNDKSNPILVDNLLRNIVNSCKMTEKLGYNTAINATYPFISQLLRLYIEHSVNTINNNDKSDYLNEQIQKSCLNLANFLIEKLKTTKQLTKCDNCNVKTGLHDALRLSFSIKHFITVSTNKSIELKTNLLLYIMIVEQQYVIIDELNTLRCPNQESYFRKLQIDVHNNAVTLNKYKYYEYSIKLFEIYLKHELTHIKNDAELRNISRALYNKSICELDAKIYKKSLLNAYLSLVFSLPDGLNSDKYMSLVIDIKAKALKSAMEDVPDEINELQSMSILTACDLLYNNEMYGGMKLFLKNLQFSSLLQHEFSVYIKLWASTAPIAGVWSSLLNLTMDRHRWVKAESKETLLWTLCDVVLETPTVVKNIQDERYKNVVLELVNTFQNSKIQSAREKIVYAALLLLKCEFDMAEASLNYGWKVAEHTIDPDQDKTIRTIEQEFNAVGSAVQAVELFIDAAQEFGPGILSNASARHIAQIMCVSVQQLLLLHMFAHATQLAYVGHCIADVAGDKETYILHASTLIYHSDRHKQVDVIIPRAMTYASELITSEQALDAALCLLCDVAIYYTKCGCPHVASKLIQYVQHRLLSDLEKQNDEHSNTDFSLGRLLEAQALLCPDSGLSMLSAVSGLHRHFLAARNTACRWTGRRSASLHARAHVSARGAAAVRLCRRAGLWRRAACSAAAALPPAGAAVRAALHADTINTHDGDAQDKITLRLKSILKTNEPLESDTLKSKTAEIKPECFTPQQDHVEIMLDSMFKRTQCSPSLSLCSVPAFQMPDFMQHANTCACHACTLPACAIIACKICHLEASTYFRAKENQIAQNYFEGARKTFILAEDKLKNIFSTYKKKKFNTLAIDIAKAIVENEFRTVQLEFLIELSLFELSRKEFAKSDDYVVSIHEILSEFKNVDPHLKNEVSNLMVASANLRKAKTVKETGLEVDMEELKLSPDKLKTPETKTMPTISNTIKVVKAEELPEKFKTIKLVKLDFDNVNENDDATVEENTAEPKKSKAKQSFKIPVPVTKKPVLENFTPRPSRSKPKIVVTQPDLNVTEISTPKTDSNLEFHTPCQSTPAEFFTPMTSIKTYSKKLNKVAKNLENDFLTPKGKVKDDLSKVTTKEHSRIVKEDLIPDIAGREPDKEDSKSDKDVSKTTGRRTRSKVETGTIKGLSEKRVFRRATSPGKLVDENKTVSRTRKVKQPGIDEK